MGQVNRVDSCRLAVARAGERAAGAVAASDAFFPFADGLAGADRRRGARRRRSRAARCATRTDRRGRQRGRRHAVLHRHPALRALSRTGPRLTAAVTATSWTARPPSPTIKAELTERVAELAEQRRRARARHRAGRRRPGQPLVRRRQAQGLRRDRHRQHPPRPAGRPRPQAEVEAVVDELNADPACTGVPRPAADRAATSSRCWRAVDPDKDVDGLHPTNLGWLVLGKPAPLPCTPTGIIELLRRYDVPIAGADVVVVGRGITVGRPLGLMLTRRSENATVTRLPHRHPRPGRARAAGRHRRRRGRLARAHHRRHGQARRRRARRRASAGSTARSPATSRRTSPTVAGCLSPNPGGVGPMTRAMLLRNVVEAAERTRDRRRVRADVLRRVAALDPANKLPFLRRARRAGRRRSCYLRRRARAVAAAASTVIAVGRAAGRGAAAGAARVRGWACSRCGRSSTRWL